MRNTLAVAAALAAAGLGGMFEVAPAPDGTSAAEQAQQAGQQKRLPGPTTQAQRAMQELLRRYGGGGNAAGGYRSREGWTNRRYQRAALKRRNKARHRAACKRAKGH